MKRIRPINIILVLIFILMSFEIVYLSLENKRLNSFIETRLAGRSNKPDLPVGTQLPEIQFELSNNNLLNIPNDQKRYLFVFFTTTCRACIDDAVLWNDLSHFSSNLNVNTIGICSADSIQVLEFSETYDFDFPIISDPQNEITKQFKIRSFPSKCLVDESGKVIFYSRGSSGKRDLKELKKIIPNLKAG